MFKSLWTHCRSINVEVFQNKVIYSIPLNHEKVFSNFNVSYNKDSQMLKLTTFQELTRHHLEESSLHTVKIEKEIPDENDKYSESYPLASHEMK
jgi:hypothetical protein